MISYNRYTNRFSSEITKEFNKLNKKSNEIEISFENRDKLIYSLTPIIKSLCKSFASNTGASVELIDLNGVAFEGAIIAVDVYLKRALKEGVKHETTISTFAYEYIYQKLGEHCKKVSTILSCGTRTYLDALKQQRCDDSALSYDGEDSKQNSGEIYTVDSIKQNEFSGGFDNGELSNMDKKESEIILRNLFKVLNPLERKVLSLSYGIGIDKKLSDEEISKNISGDFEPLEITNLLRCIKRKLRAEAEKIPHTDKYFILQNTKHMPLS